MAVAFGFGGSAALEFQRDGLDAVAKLGVLFAWRAGDATINLRDVFERKRFGFGICLLLKS